jgi:hypothetical protein
MGLFSKIFGNSDETATPGADGAQVEPSKSDERDTSPPVRAASKQPPPARDDARAPQAANDARAATTPDAGAKPARRSKPPASRAANAAKASPPEPPSRAEAVRAANAAIASPRPSVPPKVEAKLLSSTPVESSPRAPSASKQTADASKQSKRGASPPPVPGNTGSVKAVAANPTRAVGTQPLGTPEAARKAAPAAAAPARSEVRQTPPQAEPLELDLHGQSVAPPRGPVHPSDDLDSAFARIVSHAPKPPGQGTLAEDPQAKKANAELFTAMAGTHARPIKDFLLELLVGATSKQWIDVARPAAQSIHRAAGELGHPELVAALGSFNEALESAAKGFGTKVEGAERDGIIKAHAALSAALPQAFDLVKERDQREPLVVRHLLLQVPGVHKVTIDKLYAAGLASLDALCRSSIDDLVQLGRLEREGADAILSRFRQYWNERAAQPVHRTEEKARKRLATLLEQLGLAHEAFQRAEADEDREKKRDARNARRASSLAINVLLAQLGEVDLVEELERSPTERRIERVRSYVDQMARARSSQHQEAV